MASRNAGSLAGTICHEAKQNGERRYLICPKQVPFRPLVSHVGQCFVMAPKSVHPLFITSFEQLRYCSKCSKYKPDRCHHCRVCNSCVLRMDHHCPWIANCVGFRNHKYFFLLVLYSALNCWFIVVTMASTVYRAGIDEMDPGYRFGLVFGMTLAVIMGTLLGCFFFFHCWLMSNASTTIEFCEKTTAAYGSRAVSYDQGLFENIRAVLGPFVSLWLLPVAPPHGDGVNFFVHNSKGDHDEMAPLLPGNQDSETAAPEVTGAKASAV